MYITEKGTFDSLSVTDHVRLFGSFLTDTLDVRELLLTSLHYVICSMPCDMFSYPVIRQNLKHVFMSVIPKFIA